MCIFFMTRQHGVSKILSLFRLSQRGCVGLRICTFANHAQHHPCLLRNIACIMGMHVCTRHIHVQRDLASDDDHFLHINMAFARLSYASWFAATSCYYSALPLPPIFMHNDLSHMCIMIIMIHVYTHRETCARQIKSTRVCNSIVQSVEHI